MVDFTMKKFVLNLIKIYHTTKPVRSGFTKTIFGSEGTCRFYPTCSDYTAQAIDKYGVGGLGLAVWRILRCNPIVKGGYDPVK